MVSAKKCKQKFHACVPSSFPPPRLRFHYEKKKGEKRKKRDKYGTGQRKEGREERKGRVSGDEMKYVFEQKI